jgi:uncharacterized protein YdeI (YjbR/CyaY-like superfamily)
MKGMEITPTFFATPAAFRLWLARHHDTTAELWVGFYKKATGKPSVTWPEAVDQLLCFGWIDGVRRSVDSESYVIRTTPRRPGSIWSAVNTRRAEELLKGGLMDPAGEKAFRGRDKAKSELYSFENRRVRLNPAHQKQFRANGPAWEYFQSQPPGYRNHPGEATLYAHCGLGGRPENRPVAPRKRHNTIDKEAVTSGRVEGIRANMEDVVFLIRLTKHLGWRTFNHTKACVPASPNERAYLCLADPPF